MDDFAPFCTSHGHYLDTNAMEWECKRQILDHAAPIYKKSHPLSVTFTVSKYPARSFGELLKKLRLKRGLSQKKLAKKIRVNEMTVVGWEKDQREPRGRNISKLVKFFRIQVKTILETLSRKHA